MMARRIRFNAFQMNTPSHQSPGLWRHPRAGSERYLTPGYWVDFARYHLDDTIEYIDTDAGRSALASLSAADPGRDWTVREAAAFIGLGGRGPIIVGDPRQVADQLESWIDTTGADGFNLAFALPLEDMHLVVEYIMPELARRGRYETAPGGGTLREQLLGQGPRLAPAHPGSQVEIVPSPPTIQAA